MKLVLLAAIAICSIALVPKKATIKEKSLRTPVNTIARVKPTSLTGFCEANPLNPPRVFEFGNINYSFSKPAYLEYLEVDGRFFGFLVNNWPGRLLRLDFGSSLLNRPAVVDLGTMNGIIPNNTEGIQLIKDGNHWLAIIVGGDPKGGEPSSLVKIDFGTDITNLPIDGENWGNVGELNYPHDLVILKEKEQWFGFTVNTWGNSLTRFSFGTDFSKKPTAENLGNVGNFDDPTGIFLKKSGTDTRLFVTNATGRSISILDFGASVLNKPASENFNLRGISPWDIDITTSCNKEIAYVVDALNGGLARIELGPDGIINSENPIRHNNLANFDFPHSISKPYVENGNLFYFVPDANNNTLTRLEIQGCQDTQDKNVNL